MPSKKFGFFKHPHNFFIGGQKIQGKAQRCKICIFQAKALISRNLSMNVSYELKIKYHDGKSKIFQQIFKKFQGVPPIFKNSKIARTITKWVSNESLRAQKQKSEIKKSKILTKI